MKVHKYVCITASALLLFLSSFVVQAAIPRLTFTNTHAENIALYITKEVTCREVPMTAPAEDTFFFSLKLNHMAARELNYRLFRDGQEVYNYGGSLTTDKQEHQLPTAFITDQNGGFTLKATESAIFENLPPGTFYEITETPTEGYRQIEPKGGTPAVGTLTEEGASVIFRNLYERDITEESDSVILEIQKDIAFPYGYDEPQSPDFRFQVYIKGVPWSNKPFAITDEKNGRIVAYGETDENGFFSMKGGCAARFEEIPVDTDYEVREENVDGWRKVVESHTIGATVSPVTTVNFTNTETSFVVTKQMTDSSAVKIPFLFKLNKGSDPWAGAEYYLYKKSGVLLDTKKHKTNTEGKFFLFPGQAAIFTGAGIGTVYSVMESPETGYYMTVPTNSSGYLNKVVSDSIEVLPFVNHYEFSLPVTGGRGVVFYLLFSMTGIIILTYVVQKRRFD